MTAVCPRCGRDDSVQKVSAIVTGGTYQTTYSMPAQGQLGGHTIYGTVNRTGTAKTALAEKLSLPSAKDWKHLKDRWRKKPKDNWVLQEYLREHPAPSSEPTRLLRRVLIILAAIPMATSVYIWLIAGWQTALYALIAGLVLWGVERLIYRASTTAEFRQWDRQRSSYAYNLVANLQSRAEANSQELYYCHRDDALFLPRTDFCYNASEAANMGFWIQLGRI